MVKIRARLPQDYLEVAYETNDEPLSRLELAQRLTALYSNLDHGSVAVLNGRWGSGKSTFARKFVHHLSAAGIAVTYFDAFARDYTESPFLALSAHLVSEIDAKGKLGSKSAKEIKNASKKVSQKLVTTSAKIATKALTLGLVGSDEIGAFSKIADDIGSSAAELSEAGANFVFEEYLKAEAEFEGFRKSLGELSELLSEGGKNENRKTVFIIDELDRCRPDFALGIIETIKHLFDSPGIHFLLVTNIDYLEASVNAKYGLGNASQEYLEKFYDFVVFFEEGEQKKYRHAAAKIVSDRFASLIDQKETRAIHDLREALRELATAFDLSLRQASALATNAALSFLSYNERTFRPSIIIAILALYRTKFPEIYQSIKKHDYTRQQLLKPFEDVTVKDEHRTDRIRSILEFYASEEEEIDRSGDRYQGLAQMTWSYDFGSYREVFPALANHVMDRFG